MGVVVHVGLICQLVVRFKDLIDISNIVEGLICHLFIKMRHSYYISFASYIMIVLLSLYNGN